MGMVVATAFGWGAMASVIIAVMLAFLVGYSFTLIPLVRSGPALPLALMADTVSIIVMELVDNAIMLVVPGAMSTSLLEPIFWGSLVASLALAFLAAYPA